MKRDQSKEREVAVVALAVAAVVEAAEAVPVAAPLPLHKYLKESASRMIKVRQVMSQSTVM